MKTYIRNFSIVLCVPLLNACGGDSPTEPATATPPLAKFSSIQQNVFTTTCAVSGCHNGTQTPRLSAGSAYNNIVNVLNSAGIPYVDPGNANNSYLYRKLTGQNISGDRMPRGRSPLSAAVTDSIKAWIDDGAANN